MKPKTVKRMGVAAGVLAAIVVYLAVCAFSWIVTCGIIKLITLCFGLAFSWKVATGIWLAMYLFRALLSKSDSRK